ncbi:MAG: hypothetical protein ACK4PI_00040 [Tepidisphaerales bacterium]
MAETTSVPAELRATFAAIRRWQGVTRLVTVLAVVTITVIFLIFAVTTRSRIEASFTEDRVKAAVEQALPAVQPMATDAIRQMANEVIPVYQQMAAERFTRVRDALGSAAVIRLQSLPDEAGKLMAVKLDDSLRRVLREIEPEFKAKFPVLADETRRDLLVAEFFERVEQRNRELAAEVDALRISEMAKVKSVLDKFALPPDEMAPGDEELRKELMRTLLLLAMEQLEKWDGESNPLGAAIPAGQTSPPSK